MNFVQKLRNVSKKSFKLGLMAAFGFFSLLGITVAASVPDVFVYEGVLYDSANNPLTSEHEMRISLWKDADIQSTDILATGQIDTGSLNFSNWQEVQTFTPSFNGAFSVYFGGANPLGAIDFSVHKYFQVEIKALGAPDTDFEVLDPTGNLSDTVDRQEIGSVFYAKNAEYVAGHTPGDSAGNILVLDADGNIAVKHIGNGTEEDSFTLDKNNDASGNIALNFGETLGESLFWNAIQSLFEFTNSLKVGGDLVVDGSLVVNGGVTVADQFFSHEIIPSYPQATFDLDGTDNSGSMYEQRRLLNAEKRPVMVWESKSATLQDADTYIEYEIPKGFRNFQTPSIGLWFQTDGAVTDSKFDIEFLKEGVVITSETDISQNSFAEKTWDIPNGTFDDGDRLTIKIKTYSKSNNQVLLGKISINTVE